MDRCRVTCQSSPDVDLRQEGEAVGRRMDGVVRIGIRLTTMPGTAARGGAHRVEIVVQGHVVVIDAKLRTDERFPAIQEAIAGVEANLGANQVVGDVVIEERASRWRTGVPSIGAFGAEDESVAGIGTSGCRRGSQFRSGCKVRHRQFFTRFTSTLLTCHSRKIWWSGELSV